MTMQQYSSTLSTLIQEQRSKNSHEIGPFNRSFYWTFFPRDKCPSASLSAYRVKAQAFNRMGRKCQTAPIHLIRPLRRLAAALFLSLRKHAEGATKCLRGAETETFLFLQAADLWRNRPFSRAL